MQIECLVSFRKYKNVFYKSSITASIIKFKESPK